MYQVDFDVVESPASVAVPPIVATDGERLMRFRRQRDEGALAEVVEAHAAMVWGVCAQVLRRRQDVEDAFRSRGVALVEDLSPLRRHALACPALPTCGLAVAEAERILPQILKGVEEELRRRGLERASFTLRIAGCPNACSRTATADIALVGRAAGTYAIYTGGGLLGNRLNILHADNVPHERLVAEIAEILSSHLTPNGSD